MQTKLPGLFILSIAGAYVVILCTIFLILFYSFIKLSPEKREEDIFRRNIKSGS